VKSLATFRPPIPYWYLVHKLFSVFGVLESSATGSTATLSAISAFSCLCYGFAILGGWVAILPILLLTAWKAKSLCCCNSPIEDITNCWTVSICSLVCCICIVILLMCSCVIQFPPGKLLGCCPPSSVTILSMHTCPKTVYGTNRRHIKEKFGCSRRIAINYHTNATREQAQRVTNNVSYTNPKTTSYLTISRSNSHWQGRTAGIVRGKNESTKRRFNRSAKAQKVFATWLIIL
jgi:hypothetical protein